MYAPIRTPKPLRYLLLSAVLMIVPGWAQTTSDIVSQSTRDYAAQRLDEAEAALARSELAEAYSLTEQAAKAPEEYHGRGLASVSPRALGNDLYGRLFDVRYRILTAMGQKAEEEGLVYGRNREEWVGPQNWDSTSALGWYLRARNPDQVLRLVLAAPDDLAIFNQTGLLNTGYDENGKAIYTVGRVGEPLYDYDPLPREVELERRFAEEVVPAVLERIQGYAAKLLDREEQHYEKPMTEMEKAGTSGDWQQVAAAVTGVEAEPVAPSEIQIRLLRTADSKKILREAKRWLASYNVRVLVDGQEGFARNKPVAVSERAETRGDEMMSIGDDKDLPVPTRNDAYEEARDYYDIADADAKSETAYDRVLALAPEVEAYEARREAELDAAQERMQAEAAKIEQSIKDMEKTEEEKEAFREEADALEEELGF